MVLDEFHVAQRDAVAEGQGHAVAGDDAAQRAFAEDAAGAAGGVITDLASIMWNLPVPISMRMVTTPWALPSSSRMSTLEVLVETLDRRVLDRGLEQGVENVEAGLVGREPGPLDLHAAEGAH